MELRENFKSEDSSTDNNGQFEINFNKETPEEELKRISDETGIMPDYLEKKGNTWYKKGTNETAHDYGTRMKSVYDDDEKEKYWNK